MARPKKSGLEYFSFTCNYDDDKVDLLIAEFGIMALGIYVSLLQKIYRNGYFIKWGEDEALLFAKQVNAGIKEVNAVINRLLFRNLLDSGMYEKYQILTSNGIQFRYFSACVKARRLRVDVIQEYLLFENLEELSASIFQLRSLEERKEPKERRNKVKERERERESKVKETRVNPEITQVNAIINYMNEIGGTNYKFTLSVQNMLNRLLSEGFTIDQMKLACTKQLQHCKRDKCMHFYNPKTLFKDSDSLDRALNRLQGDEESW